MLEYRHLACMLALGLLSACGAPPPRTATAPTITAILPTPLAPAISASPAPTASPLPTNPPVPTAPPPTRMPARIPPTLRRDGAGWHLEVIRGQLLNPTWRNASQLLVTWFPEPLYTEDATLEPGVIVLADLASEQTTILDQHGSLAAVFADGSLLVRTGWVDAALELIAPDGTRTAIAPGGPWSDSWTMSPDARSIAWLEWDAPPGDWSKRMPHACCSGEPHPRIRSIAVWEAAGGLRHLPAEAMRWAFSTLRWRADSRALLVARQPEDDFRVDLLELTLDGAYRQLASHTQSDALTLAYEGDDGALFYGIGGIGANDWLCVRRDPDGQITTLAEMDFDPAHPHVWSTDTQGHLIIRYGFEANARIEVYDLATNRRLSEAEADQALHPPPTAPWRAEPAQDGSVQISPLAHS